MKTPANKIKYRQRQSRSGKIMQLRIVFVLVAFLFPRASCFAQANGIESAARDSIRAGNLAWVNGVKNGDMTQIAATYSDDALDCGQNGECEKGRSAIEKHLRERFEKAGRASDASVASAGSVQAGDSVYEWGSARAVFANGYKIEGRYLTVWQRQKDGSFKIFRNLAIPEDNSVRTVHGPG
jgi:ketosteroid isomerase-like protein